jgi:hypothetical protein
VERIILTHGFRSFSLWSLGSFILWLVMRQNITAEMAWQNKAADFIAAMKQRESQERTSN